MEIHLGKRKFKFNTKFLLISFLGMTLSGLFMGALFYGLYNTAKKSLINDWKNNVIEASSAVDYYLTAPTDAVEFTSVKANEMIRQDAALQDISEYIKSESEVYSSMIKGGHSGIYGCFRGEFIDGSGWVPEDNFEPKTRPWYLAAVEGKGRSVITSPYLSVETHTMMISVSRLLEDGESVVAMDLFMVELQEQLQRIVAQNNAKEALIIDKYGMVVAHSDYLEVGKNYSTDHGEIGVQLVDALVSTYDGSVILNGPDENLAAFFDRCSKGWYVVLVIDEQVAFRPLKQIYLLAGLALFVVLAIVFAIINYLGFKQNEVEHLGREVLAVADIYISMMLIDVDTDTISLVRKNTEIDRFFGGDFTGFSYRIGEIADKLCSKRYAEMVSSFMDTGTLDERLGNANTISCEFVDSGECWLRMRYIAMKRGNDGHVSQVLMALESIDNDKKKQEQLQHLSETDRMTGIMNRGSAEQKIREKLPEIDSGMFCLMDADKFKYVNDTFGHAVGDKVIIAIANALVDSFRDSDVVFRLGGDEFAAFAVNVNDTEIGERILNRFFNRIDNIDIPEMNGHRISVSVGAAFYDAQNHESFEKLYERADKGTYMSKKIQGNKVSFVTIDE